MLDSIYHMTLKLLYYQMRCPMINYNSKYFGDSLYAVCSTVEIQHFSNSSNKKAISVSFSLSKLQIQLFLVHLGKNILRGFLKNHKLIIMTRDLTGYIIRKRSYSV